MTGSACAVCWSTQNIICLAGHLQARYHVWSNIVFVTSDWHVQVMQMHLTGSWSAGQVKEGLELAMGGCQQLRGLMRQTLLDAAADDDEDSDAAGDDAMQEG
jgi:ribonuclease PH